MIRTPFLLLPLLLLATAAPTVGQSAKQPALKVLRRNPEVSVKILKQRTVDIRVREDTLPARNLRFLIASVRITNRSKREVPALPGTFYAEAMDGEVYTSFSQRASGSFRFEPIDTVIRPKGTAEGEVGFLVPRGTKAKRVEWFPSPAESLESKR
jgi:hypothetical protein